MAELNSVVEKTIETIRKRSKKSRANYLERVAMMEADPDSNRVMIGCSNLAHVAAGATDDQADLLKGKNLTLGLSRPITTCCRRISLMKISPLY